MSLNRKNPFNAFIFRSKKECLNHINKIYTLMYRQRMLDDEHIDAYHSLRRLCKNISPYTFVNLNKELAKFYDDPNKKVNTEHK